jgi:hypothetical protein
MAMLHGLLEARGQVERIIGGEAVAVVGGFDAGAGDLDPLGRMRGAHAKTSSSWQTRRRKNRAVTKARALKKRVIGKSHAPAFWNRA